MSWTDIYPLLSDEMLDAYRAGVTSADDTKMDEWLGVAAVFNRQQSSHLVVVTISQDPDKLGYSPSRPEDEPVDADGRGWLAWFDFNQLLEGAEALQVARPDTVLRVYLAADLVGLIDRLTAVGCEVFLMKGASILKTATSMWRFLALEEEGRWITFTHASFGREMIHDVERTEHVMATDLGFWRAPQVVGERSQRLEARSYRPINAEHFGSKGGWPAELLMRALIWHCLEGSMPLGCAEGSGERGYPLEGSDWSSDGFAEWFLLTAVYPRVAFEGVLTFLIWQRKWLSYWYAIDIEYVTWANAASEVILSRKIITEVEPWEALSESSGVTIRPDTQIVRRKRKPTYVGLASSLPAREILPFELFEGDLRSLLEWTGANVASCWWVDFSSSLRAIPTGAELFLDRRYEDADVVVCGHYFLKITREVADWAIKFGLEPGLWREGWICKLPKLEGLLTLWRTEFSREFHRALVQETAGPEVLLAAWIQSGKARVMASAAGKMGWKLN